MIKKISIVVFTFLTAISCIACGKEEQVVKEVDTVEVGEAINQSAENIAPDIDINGCDTFTQIVDKKLEDGMGWTNTDFGDTNVLMVCSGTYDNLDGNTAGIDATFFIYKDAVPKELGKVCSGGTAYPLAKNDVYLYTASNHWICKYIVTEDGVKIMENAMVEYDSDGKETYYYVSQESGTSSEISQTEAEELFYGLYEEMENAEVICFDTKVGE